MKDKLLLLHGALGSEKQFSEIKEKLEESFEVHCLNFEGHGGSESSNEFSIDLFSQNVLDYLETHSLEQVKIFGYSMGGYVSLYTALKVPTMITKILTLGTKFNWDIEAAENELRMMNPAKIEEKVPQFAEKLRLEHHPQDWKLIMNKTGEMMIMMAKGAKLTDSDFKRIGQEVVIGVGSLDNMVSYEESEHVAQLLPNSTLIQLDQVKHPIDKIEPNKLIDYIISNLS